MKNLYRRIPKRLMLGLAMLLCSLNIAAQSVDIRPKETNYLIKKDNVYYSVVNSDSIKYEINVTEGYTITKLELELVVNNGSTVAYTPSEDKKSIAFKATEPGKYTLSGSVTVKKDNGGETKVNVTDVPAIEIVNPDLVLVKDEYVVYHDKEYTITFTDISKPANIGSWEIDWETTDEASLGKKEDELTFSAKFTNETGSVKNVKCYAISKYCIGGKQLYEKEDSVNVTVYPKVRFDDDAEVTLNTAKDTTFIQKDFTAKGGYPGGWKYTLKLEEDNDFNQKVEEGHFDIKIEESDIPSDDTVLFSMRPSNGSKTRTYKLIAENYYSPEPEKYELWDSIVKIYTVNIYPKTGLEYDSDSIYNFAKDSTFTLSVKESGGYDRGWKYKWFKNGNKINNSTHKETFTEKPGDKLKVITYKVDATNTAENGDTLASHTKEFKINVYPAPGADQEKEIYNYLESESGDYAPLKIEYDGGYPDGWRIIWRKGDTTVPSFENKKTFEVTYEAAVEGEKYYADVSNIFKENETEKVWYSKTFEFEVNKYPKTSIEITTDSVFNTAKEEQFELGIKVKGGREKGWTYQWKRNDKDINDNIFSTKDTTTCLVQEKTPTDNAVDEIKYTVVATNKAKNDEVLSKLSKTFSLNVYKKPKFSKKLCHEQVVDGIEFIRSVSTEGGYPDGWTIKWSREDRGIDRTGIKEHFTESYNESDSSHTKVKYTVRAINKFEDEVVWCDSTVQFDIKVYPAIKLDSLIADTVSYDLYQDTLALGAIYKGGVDVNDNGSWSYEWKNMTTNQMVECSENRYVHDATNNNNTIREDNYKLTICHNVGGDIIWKDSVKYNIKSYPKARFKIVTKQNTILCGDNEVKLGIEAKCADEDGWKFVWERDGERLPNDSLILKYREENDGTESLTHGYKLRATNIHNGETWVDSTFTFSSIVRPKLEVPTEWYSYEDKYREGDTIILGVDNGKGGYRWEYTWYKIDNNIQKAISAQTQCALNNYVAAKKIYTHNHKEERTESYALRVRNVDADGVQEHYNNTFPFEVKIYRRPNMPIKLVQKGLASNIFIVDMNENSGLDNDTLAANDYNFAFGYVVDSVHIEIERSDYTLRYQTYTTQQAGMSPWAYTYWIYEDGYKCMSDTVKCQTSSVTRFTDDELTVNHSGFKASLQTPMTATVKIMAFDGTFVKQKTYDAQVEFDEKFDLTGMNDGLYLIEVCVGEYREVNKIFIKK